jgi:phosphoglycolate phosphatase
MNTLFVGNKQLECQLVIFDKDGTLTDLHRLSLERGKARRDCILSRGGSDVSELWERIVGVNLQTETIDQNGPLASLTCKEEILVATVSFYLNRYSWDDSKQMVQEAYIEADSSMKPLYGTVLLHGVLETLSTLRHNGFKLAIASTDTRKRMEESFKALKIDTFFDAIVGGDDVENGKPAPDMILKAAEQTRSKLEETIIVGDSVNDMKMGKNAGVKACIGVLTSGGTREKLGPFADIIVDSITELNVRIHKSGSPGRQIGESK